MLRRSLLGSVGLVFFSGACVELESEAFDPETDDSTNESDTEDPLDEELELLQATLENAGVDILSLERSEEDFALEVQTKGNFDEDINRVASAYSTVAPDVAGNLQVRVEDRGLTVGRFSIEHVWAERHATAEWSDEEYLLAINETVSES